MLELFRFAFNRTQHGKGRWIITFSLLSALPVHAAAPGKENRQHYPILLEHANPDILLNQIYQKLAANNLQAAQEKADVLVAAFPNFRLGHLMRGDLLLMHTQQVKPLGAAYAQESEKLQELRAEAMARLHSIRKRPDPSLIPRALLMLRRDQKHALVADTKQSRLYVYENQGGQPRLLADYYVSQGKLGSDKFKEGDKKHRLAFITLPVVFRHRGCRTSMVQAPCRSTIPMNGTSARGVAVRASGYTVHRQIPLAVRHWLRRDAWY